MATALSKGMQKRIRGYLDAVRAHLGHHAEPERVEILQNLEAHVREALAARGEAPSPEDLEAVLAEMDPPETYGQAPAGAAACLPLPNARFCWMPVLVGILLVVLSLPLAALPILFTFRKMAASGGGGIAVVGEGISRSLLIPWAMFPVITTGMGLWGIRKIRESHGHLYGLKTMVVAALLFPLLILDWALIAAADHLLLNPRQHMNHDRDPWLLLLCGLVILAADIWIARMAWRKAKRLPTGR